MVFDIITTFFEMNVFQTAVLADFLNCQKYLPPAAAIQTSVNKLLMRLKVQQSRLNQPLFTTFNESNIGKGYDFYKKNQKPMVVKPIHSGHSFGSRYLKKGLLFSEFKALVGRAVIDLAEGYDEWMDFENPKITRCFLLEEFIGGEMLSCDGVVRSVGDIEFFGTNEFEIAQPPLLDQISHVVPAASFNQKQIEQCLNYSRKIVKALGMQYCGFHCELKYNHHQPYLIEISGRLPGGTVLQAYQETSKLNIFDWFFSIFENSKQKIRLNREYYSSVGNAFIYSKQKFGKVVSLTQKPRGVKNITVSFKTINKNEVVGGWKNRRSDRGSWLANINARSKTVKSWQIISALREIRKNLSIQIDDRLSTLTLLLIKKVIAKLPLKNIISI